MSLENYLTITETADMLGCTEGRIRQLLRDKKLKGKKFHERAWAIERVSAEKYAAIKQTVGRPRIHA